MAKQLSLLSYVKAPNLARNRDSKTAAGGSDILYFVSCLVLPEVYITDTIIYTIKQLLASCLQVNSAHIWFLTF